jgi:hypothetical protein
MWVVTFHSTVRYILKKLVPRWGYGGTVHVLAVVFVFIHTADVGGCGPCNYCI